MTLFKGPDGTYEADYRVKGMPRLHLSMRTKKKGEAQDRYNAVRRVFRERRGDMVTQLKDGTLTVERVTAMVQAGEALAPLASQDGTHAALSDTIDAASDRYLAWIELRAKSRQESEGTHRVAKYQLKRFRDFVYEGVRTGDRPVHEVTSALIQAYQQQFHTDNKPTNTVTTYVSRVSALWNWLERQEAREAREAKRPARVIYSPIDPELAPRGTHARDRVLTPEEVTQLLSATPEQMMFPVACGLFAGFRLGEVLHLRPMLDVDVALGALSVRNQWPVWKPKTKRAIRTVPIAEPLKPILERHLAKYATPSWVLPGFTDRSKPLESLTFRQQFKKVVERAGITYGRDKAQGVTFHTLRHTFASHAVMRGVDLYTVAQLLGDSLAVTEATYSHLSRDFKALAIAKVAAAFTVPDLPEAA